METSDELNTRISRKIETVKEDSIDIYNDMGCLLRQIKNSQFNGTSCTISNIIRRLSELQHDLSNVTALKEAVEISNFCDGE